MQCLFSLCKSSAVGMSDLFVNKVNFNRKQRTDWKYVQLVKLLKKKGEVVNDAVINYRVAIKKNRKKVKYFGY